MGLLSNFVPEGRMTVMEQRGYVVFMRATKVGLAKAFRYLCPEQHATSIRNEQHVDKPLYTAIICRAPIGEGKRCNQFSVFVEDRDFIVKDR